MNMVDHALKYAAKGRRIFPCGLDKKPLINDWPNKATSDPPQIKDWWGQWPEASIGMPCGKANGVWVLDVDQPNGPESLESLEFTYSKLPKTSAQKTGGNGVQYFWKWNGREIRNTTGLIHKDSNLDVRGEGGYVIVPPSGHPSGNRYEWVDSTEPIEAPAWLANLAFKKESTAPSAAASTSTYGEKALAGEITKLSRATEGDRNSTLNNCALALGQLIAGGELDRPVVEASLYGVALSIGLKDREIRATIKSGIEKGMQSPRSNPHKEESKYYIDPEEISKQGKQSKQSNEETAAVSTGKQEVSKDGNLVSSGKQTPFSTGKVSPYNLAAHIEEWIVNSTGSFTVDQLDREFCLTTREQKNNRSKCLSIYKEKRLIKKDKTIKGKWHVLDSSVEWVDLDKEDEAPFPIILPFDLHEKVSIPRKSVIILAGSTNAGKTALILNTLKLNIRQSYEKVYLMSEMEGGQYKDRILGFGDPVSLWQTNVKAAHKSYDFDGTIQHHNPDGLTCIDYLEEIDGEYFKIPSSVRDIYDALGMGVAMIAIQKKSTADFGRGGEATKDKARLYMTLDYLCALEHCIICALKLTKVKKSIGGNMQDKELHFRIERGSQLSVVMDWTYSSKVNRTKCVQRYMQEGGEVSDIEYKFMTKEGTEVTLRPRDYESWSTRYHGFNLDQVLSAVSERSYAAPWMTAKSWFWQLGSYLDKKERELA